MGNVNKRSLINEQAEILTLLHDHPRGAPKPLKLGLVNCRSLLSKLCYIQTLLSEEALDILCVNETWLNPSIPDECLGKPGHKIYRKDRSSTSLPWSLLDGGGVAMFVH